MRGELRGSLSERKPGGKEQENDDDATAFYARTLEKCTFNIVIKKYNLILMIGFRSADESSDAQPALCTSPLPCY